MPTRRVGKIRADGSGASEAICEFIEKNRSYVIDYNLGEDMVKHYIEKRGGTQDQPENRWAVFQELLSSPRLPSGLQ